MLTGDHPVTARAIAASLGLDESDVYARITPADKLRIVEELQQRGEVVAVTGDGVNDAPALRRADVGIAMGRSGSEAAREASDVVLTNDELGTIVAAVHEGRRIYDNITKFVAFLLSANLGEVALFAVAILAGMGAPMTIVQVLVINLVTDGLPAVALARDPALPGRERLLRRRTRALLSGRMWAALAVVGLLVGAAAFAAFMVGRALGGGAGQTMAFLTVGLAELAFVFSCRSVLRPAWQVPRNAYLNGGVAASLLRARPGRLRARARRVRDRAAQRRGVARRARARARARRGRRARQGRPPPVVTPRPALALHVLGGHRLRFRAMDGAVGVLGRRVERVDLQLAASRVDDVVPDAGGDDDRPIGLRIVRLLHLVLAPRKLDRAVPCSIRMNWSWSE